MRSARLALVTAIAATTLLAGTPAQARHTCGFDELDERVDAICESHPETLLRKLLCLVSPIC
jgi:hypothetical protein